MVSIATVKTIFFTLAPFLLPRLVTYFRTARAQAQSSPLPVIPLPNAVRRSLNILFLSAAIALISTLPRFSSENIFERTASRLQTPNDVLFNRLAAIRGAAGLTEDDNALKPKLASLESRCLYLVYGPDVVRHCPFCISDEPMTYFYYALPSLLLPHIQHLFLLGIATSSILGGKAARRWRTVAATIVGTGLAVADLYLVATYDYRANSRVYRADNYLRFFWTARVFRGIIICLADIVIAAVLYASGTNRMFVIPLSTAERTEAALKILEQARGKINAIAILRNAVVRDEGLRRRTDAYWIREGKVMSEVMDEREVVEGIRNALEGRVQVTRVEDEARKFAESITNWPSPQPSDMLPDGQVTS